MQAFGLQNSTLEPVDRIDDDPMHNRQTDSSHESTFPLRSWHYEDPDHRRPDA